MRSPLRAADLSLTVKILLMVGLLGLIGLANSLYSMDRIRNVNQGYRGLVDHEARAALQISDATLLLSEASRRAYAVLTEQEEQRMREAGQAMHGLQGDFEASLTRIRPLIPGHATTLDSIAAQVPVVFDYAQAIVDSAARWRGDRALTIIHEEFEPALRRLQQDMEALRHDSLSDFTRTADQLNQATRATIVTAAIVTGGGLMFVLLLSGYVSITRISRPITALTHIMQRLTLKHYDDVIPGTDRRDEVGTMAQAMQVFKDSMQRADSLSIKVVQSEQARQLADQMAKEKAAFLALMSHEIRTPLNAVLGMAQLALKFELSPPQRMRVETMLQAGRHLLAIINDILDLSKMDNGKLVLEQSDFNLEDMLANTVALVQDSAASKGLPLKVEIAPDTPRLLRGDPMRISQILLNYLSNAIKFTSSGEIRLALDVRTTADAWQLHGSVTDTGMGLSATQLEGLFQPFSQADATITRRFGGTGLGLAICRRLAEAMHGTTGASSTPGKGSTFWFTVDVAPGDQPDHAAAPASQTATADTTANSGTNPNAHTSARTAIALASEADARRLHGQRILLVDDNALNRIVATELLQTGGLLVDTAADGQAAIDTLQAAPDQRYCAVLMDMQMPVMDGLTATRRLRSDPRFADLPIFAMTANASQDDMLATEQAGMNAHIAKPIDEFKLWETLLRSIPASALAPAIGLPTQAEPSSHLFNQASLTALRQRFSPTRFDELLALFIQDCQARINRINAALAAGDTGTIAREAHDIIGTSGNFGMYALAEKAAVLGTAARNGNSVVLNQAAAQLMDIAARSLQALKASPFTEKHE